VLLTELLDHDLHRSRGGTPVPFMIEVPVPKDSFPAVVSSTRGRFLVSRRPREGGLAGVGVFDHDSDKLDSVIGPMLSVAHSLSDGQIRTGLQRVRRRVRGRDVMVPVETRVPGSFKNSFAGPGAAKRAFDHIQSSSGLKFQPHFCLVPSSWNMEAAGSFFGGGLDVSKRRFMGCCKVAFHDVPMPVFFSRPDMVGMYTQFMNGGAAIILHNVEFGLAFCPQV